VLQFYRQYGMCLLGCRMCCVLRNRNIAEIEAVNRLSRHTDPSVFVVVRVTAAAAAAALRRLSPSLTVD